MVAAITISTSSAYAFGEVAHRPHSLNLPFQQGKSFYLVLILEAAAAAGLVLIPGIPLVYIVLVVNVIAVLAMPPALLFLYMLVNDREIMGDLVSPLWANILALGVVVRPGRRRTPVRNQRSRAPCAGVNRRQIDGLHNLISRPATT